MATVWDAARALLATAGTEEAAMAAALELAALCRRAREFAEAEFWRAAADAVAWECNPQPLIAPQLGADTERNTRKRRSDARRRFDLPSHRSTVLRFRRDLRELWDRYRPADPPAGDPKEDPDT
jgi:hypothetical protein